MLHSTKSACCCSVKQKCTLDSRYLHYNKLPITCAGLLQMQWVALRLCQICGAVTAKTASSVTECAAGKDSCRHFLSQNQRGSGHALHALLLAELGLLHVVAVTQHVLWATLQLALMVVVQDQWLAKVCLYP